MGGLPGQFLSQSSRITGERESGLQIHHAILDQLRDLGIEMLHALGFAIFDGIEQGAISGFSLFNALAGASVGFEDFEGGYAPAAIRLWYVTRRVIA